MELGGGGRRSGRCTGVHIADLGLVTLKSWRIPSRKLNECQLAKPVPSGTGEVAGETGGRKDSCSFG